MIINSGRLINASAFSFFELGTDLFIPFIGLGSILGFYYYIVAYKNLGRSFCLLEESDMELSELPLELYPKEVLPGKIGATMEKIVNKLVNLDEKIGVLYLSAMARKSIGGVMPLEIIISGILAPKMLSHISVKPSGCN